MTYPKPLFIARTASTNSFLDELCNRQALPELTCIYTAFQSAGRGQRGNSWESEDGKNLLFSFVLFPHFLQVHHQFLLSEITALALQEALSAYTEGITIKWPNDIYWHDRKLCGTLIENDWTGNRVSRSISGTGVNLNQERFVSDAPNPVSLYQITGKNYDAQEILLQILERGADYYQRLQAGDEATIVGHYLSRLYRREGLHPYQDATSKFRARIVEVEPTGRLVLEDEHQQLRSYYFKEVTYLPEQP
ncbi:MAG: biotin--[acetyl-CoA-carboxylase] ligase [Phocaeicola plebeius]|nr:biotin--[acetyl-CoA-carboxylase] ligase [Phocaeicola plebeius]